MRGFRPILLLVVVVAGGVLGRSVTSSPTRASALGKQYLPIVINEVRPENDPPRSPFLGFETSPNKLAVPGISSRADELNVKWVRLNSLSWREIQPTPDPVYNWGAAAEFERDLRATSAAQLTPIVVVDDHPRWATVADSNCAAIKQEQFDAFAAFMRALVVRYQTYPYNVHNWELGNEPDVDPKLFNFADSVYGCWGNDQDRFYGGGHYGNMLKVVTPKIKEVDPTARVWIGGLLLWEPPDTCTALPSEAGCFFEGILRSDAAPFFDVLPYHSYGYFRENSPIDHSGVPGPEWGSEGLAKGKTRFLKEVMARYGVSKPLFLNESALLCPTASHPRLCTNPSQVFFESQANHVARLVTRTLSEGVEGVIWYTLDGPGWENSGLLDAAHQPRPAYRALQTLSNQTMSATGAPVQVDDYGAGTEAYRFTVPGKLVDVVWSLDPVPNTVRIPANEFIAAYRWDGTPIGNTTFPVGFSAVYVHRLP